MFEIIQVVVLSLSVSWARSHVMWEAPNELQPVHGLFVKPSIDGTTGDLYVAATEDNGIKTQWLTDQPVNFLPAATNLQPKIVPLSSSLAKTTSQEDKIKTQKRAIITRPALKYAFALPIPGADGNLAPYAVPAKTSSEESVNSPCTTDVPAQPYPFHYFYPQMLSAIASAMKSYKENESNEDTIPIAAPIPYWPQAYGYPYQYVFVDPNTLSQSQTDTVPSEALNSSSSESM